MNMNFLKSKVAIFFLILGALILCSMTPRFEGYEDTVYTTDDLDNPDTEPPPNMMPYGDSTDPSVPPPPGPPPPGPPPPPDGIPYYQIPNGEEDLYILKSQIVPPVCPACPTACPKSKKNGEECPACPPCGRCPQPSYDCKLVPNYDTAPQPVLNDFSAF